MSVQYIVRRGLVDGVDYNGDGVIDENDDVVVKYIDGKAVEQVPLKKSDAKQLTKIMTQQPTQDEPMQRIIYNRAPNAANMENPPPVIIKDQTGFVQGFKNAAGTGAGFAVGQGVVEGAFGLLGSLFSNDGGGKKRRRRRSQKHRK